MFEASFFFLPSEMFLSARLSSGCREAKIGSEHDVISGISSRAAAPSPADECLFFAMLRLLWGRLPSSRTQSSAATCAPTPQSAVLHFAGWKIYPSFSLLSHTVQRSVNSSAGGMDGAQRQTEHRQRYA